MSAMGVVPGPDDEDEIKHSVATLYEGIRNLEMHETHNFTPESHSQVTKLKHTYSELVKDLGSDVDEYMSNIPTRTAMAQYSNEPYRDDPAESRLFGSERLRKNVRFRDDPREMETSNNDLLQMQTQTMHDQDNSLDALSISIGRQRELSIQIGDELDEHGELLDDVDAMVDHSASRLNQAKNNLSNFSRKARENSHVLTICLLILILVLLLAIL